MVRFVSHLLLFSYGLFEIEGFVGTTTTPPHWTWTQAHGTIGIPSTPLAARTTAKSRTRMLTLGATTDDEDDDDDDDEDDFEEAESLGDWRRFRASLIDQGLPGGTSSDDAALLKQQEKTEKKISVAGQNEALLEQQNQALAEEYRTGVWAHTIQQVEVGGLLCRMPLEAELYRGRRGGYWKDKLDVMMSLEHEIDAGDTDKVDEKSVNRWFPLAERMIGRELRAINDSGKIQNGILNPNDLGENERILLDKYLNYKQTWQEICLVTSHNPESGCSEALILNRPITKSINKQLATLLLEGSDGSCAGSFSYDFVDMVVKAFGKEAGVYMGGPDQQEEPAILVHGISNLRGAHEIAPGTNLYQGGLEAAVEGVLEGFYKPLDFRFFLGRQLYDPKENPKRGSLIGKVEDGAYQPVACARSLALKQCLGLPKPLWHEVLELCGGELQALSSIELRKRIDLQQ